MATWKKVFANHISDKGLIFRIKTTKTEQQKKSQTKWGKDLNRHFFKDDTWMDNMYTQRYST